ncbi:hypothetical protein GALL_457140 [mine drainage metagenome]|uniref:DUF1173 family protein n=1 Tax=mine drainage metagenome TaxID=410659 RepID=A0A1J5PND4_9ZZZZ
MGNTSIRVRRTGQILDVRDATASTEARKRLLAPHHGSATVECLCTNPPIPMTVAHRTIPSETWYLVAADREQAKRHAPDCLARQDGAGTPAAPESAGPAAMIDETGVTLARGFLREWRESTPERETPPPRASRDPDTAPRGVGLVGLLWMLWSQAGLNLWKPGYAGKRDWDIVRLRLRDAAARIRSAKADHWTLADDLFVPPQFNSREAKSKATSEAFHGALNAALASRRVVFLLGEIKSATRLPDGAMALRLHNALPSIEITVPPGLAGDLERAASAWNGLVAAERTDRRILLSRVRRTVDGATISCVGAGVMRVDANAIPFDSSYERRVAALLTEQGRAFAKPFTQGNAPSWWARKMDALGVAPDYVLTDLFPGVFCEVLGRMSDREYRSHAEAKLATYRRAGVPLWAWNPSEDADPPPLPEKQR